MTISSKGRSYALAVGGGIASLAVGIALAAPRAEIGGWMLVFTDAFTLAGVVMLSVALLIWVARCGFFDLFVYGSRRLLGLIIPPLGIFRESYYDYKARRTSCFRLPVLPSLLVGSAFFAVSLALTLIISA